MKKQTRIDKLNQAKLKTTFNDIVKLFDSVFINNYDDSIPLVYSGYAKDNLNN